MGFQQCFTALQKIKLGYVVICALSLHGQLLPTARGTF